MFDIQRTFAAGEVSPALWARADVARYHASVQTCLNFRVRPEGGVTTRTGTQYVGTARNVSARLIPFNVSDTLTYIIEVTPGKFRFWKNGAPVETSPGVPYEVTNTYTSTQVDALQWTQSIDVLFLVTGDATPYALRRFSDLSWTWGSHPTGPLYNVPYTVLATGTAGTDTIAYKITAVVNGLESRPSFGAAGFNGTVNAAVSPWTVNKVGHGLETGDEVFMSGRVLVGSIEYYTITKTDANNFTLNATVADAARSGLESMGKSFYQIATLTKPASGTAVTLTWGYTGASYYNIYRQIDGAWGFIGSSYTTTFKDTGFQPDTALVPPANYDQADVLGYPGSVDIMNQRLVYGGWSRNPEAVAMSPVGNYSTLDPGTNDGDAFNFSLAGQPVGEVNHVVGVGNKVAALTSTAEWLIAGDSNGSITPTQINARKQSGYGASVAAPLVVGNALLFVNRTSTNLRELVFSYDSDSLKSRDLARWAPHLFDGQTVVRVAYNDTVNVVWAVLSNGTMLGLTYLPEQEVWGWHRHTTDGLIRDVAVVMESGFDRTYLLVDRVIGGVTYRYVERMAFDLVGIDPADAKQLDAYLYYSGAPATVMSGLAHLEGKIVYALADGGVQGPYTVTAGSITLGRAGSKVVVGLPFVADLKTLPIEQSDGQTLIDAKKNVIKVRIHCAKTSGFKAGTDENHLDETPITMNTGFGAAEELKNGTIEVHMSGTWDDIGVVLIRQDKPLPLTVLSIAPTFRVGGK